MSEALNLVVDINDLTLDEIDVVEIISGQSLETLGEGNRQGPLLRAMAVIMKHREDPNAYPISTPEDIEGSKLRVGSLRVSLADPDETDPDETDPAPSEDSGATADAA